MTNFSSYYLENAAVFETLSGISPEGYAKYLRWISETPVGGRVLDVGCGVGYSANELARRGFEAYGIDANKLAIAEAAKGPAKFVLAQDYTLPFADGFFDTVGSYTVIEHVGDPDMFLDEQVRVLRPGGRLVVGCPNFMQVAGLASHHPRTRGLKRKIVNALELAKKSLGYRVTGRYRFTRMEPIVREHFEPDDDAIVVTNAVDVSAALRARNLTIEFSSGTDRYFPEPLETIGKLPFVRSIIGAVFIVARKA